MDSMTEPEKARVFITNYAGHDYEDAQAYGEFIWITRGYISFQSLDRVKYTIAEEVVKSRPQDWLLLSGKPIISVVSALIWFQLHKKIKLLIWDQKMKGKKYRELVITERNLNELLDVLAQGVAIERGG